MAAYTATKIIFRRPCNPPQRGAEHNLFARLLDGATPPPRSAEDSLRITQDTLTHSGTAASATPGGRYYAMDRDKRWDRGKATTCSDRWSYRVSTPPRHIEGLHRCVRAR